MRNAQQPNALDAASHDQHVKGHGKNFAPLIAAGSWQICGFHYGKAKCACCGRPICHVLHLKNDAHEVSDAFPETIEIGIVCGPKVFIESCVGFYSDPTREWERQHRVWKDFINYTILCVKHEKMWQLIPEGLRVGVDEFLSEGYKAQDHSGGWWAVKDAKKRFLKSQRVSEIIPEPRVLYAASRSLMYAAHRQAILSQNVVLQCDYHDGRFSLVERTDDRRNT